MSHWTREHSARKEHVCLWCQEAIPVGERYVAQAGNIWGDFYSYKTHSDCAEAIHRSRSMYDEYLCDATHARGKSCEETPCANV